MLVEETTKKVIKAIMEDFLDSAHKLMWLSGYSIIEAMNKSHKMLHEIIPEAKQEPLPIEDFIKACKKDSPSIDPNKPLDIESRDDLILAYVQEHYDRIFGSDED